jgi:hypothetical protein
MDVSMIEGIILIACTVSSAVGAWVTIRNGTHIKQTKSQIQEVHVLVNARLDSALEKIGRLQDQIKDSNGRPTT